MEKIEVVQRVELRHAKIAGFISIKGGVGKTTAVANLGYVLAKEFGKQVLVVDANFSNPNLSFQFGIVKPEGGFGDVLLGRTKLQNVIRRVDDRLDILPASFIGGRGRRHVSSRYAKLGQYLSSLRSFYDVILIDASPSLNEELLATILASDELFVITTPDYVTLASTLHAIKVARERRTHIAGIILNKVRNRRYELGFGDIQWETKVPVVSVLYYDEKVLQALAKGKPLSFCDGDSDSAVEYKKLAAALIGERYRDKRLKARIGRLFSRELRQDEINRAIVMVSHY